MHIPANLNPYWLLIKDLDTAEKLSLIELLVKSIQSAPSNKLKKTRKQGRRTDRSKDDWVLQFNGSWNDFPETAEDMIKLVEGARTPGRLIESI